MTNVKKNERFIPIKNYVLAVVIVVVMILLTLYGFEWYKVLKESKVSTSYLVKEKIISNEIKGLNEVNDVFSEAPDNYYLYISYTGSEEIYNMEKDLKKVINDYSLNDSMYFLNVSNIKDEEDYIDQINKALNLENKKVKKVPTIIYYNDGKVVDIIERLDDNIMNVGDFEKLLESNRVAKE
ncbi:MAG: DUF6568 family protein [Candidatus Coprovivens sp.]